MQCSMSFQTDLLSAFEANTTLTDGQIFDTTNDLELNNALDFYNCRNAFLPLIANATEAEMMTIFPSIEDSNAGLSVILDTIRNRQDWYPSHATGLPVVVTTSQCDSYHDCVIHRMRRPNKIAKTDKSHQQK